jgi:integrase
MPLPILEFFNSNFENTMFENLTCERIHFDGERIHITLLVRHTTANASPLLSDYIRTCAKTHKKKTAELYRLAAREVSTFADVPLDGIDADWLESFKAHLLSKHQQNTAFIYFVKVRAAINKAFKRKLIAANPCDDVKRIKAVPAPRRYLSEDDLKKLAACPRWRGENDFVRLAFLFQFQTGLAFSDIAALRWCDVLNEEIKIVRKKTGEAVIVPLSTFAQDLAKRAKALSESKGKPIGDNAKIFHLPTLQTYLRGLRVWGKKAGVDVAFTSHWARHSCATHLVNKDVPLQVVQEILGHSDIKTTAIYAKLNSKTKRAAVEKLTY